MRRFLSLVSLKGQRQLQDWTLPCRQSKKPWRPMSVRVSLPMSFGQALEARAEGVWSVPVEGRDLRCLSSLKFGKQGIAEAGLRLTWSRSQSFSFFCSSDPRNMNFHRSLCYIEAIGLWLADVPVCKWGWKWDLLENSYPTWMGREKL